MKLAGLIFCLERFVSWRLCRHVAVSADILAGGHQRPLAVILDCQEWIALDKEPVVFL